MRPGRAAAALGAGLLAGAAFFFFQEVRAVTSDATAGDAAWIRQVVHNSTHGRPFQLSVYYNNLGGVRRNPHAYANTLALHSNLTPLLVAQLYRAAPTEEGLFALVMLFNYLGAAFWMFWTLKDDPQASETVPVAVLGLALWCGFFWTVCEKNHFPLYSGPFVFALHYFRSKPGAAFWAAFLLCLGVSEDTAMFLACYGAYLVLFEPPHRRRGVAVSVLAVAWVVVFVWLQGHVLRQGMELARGSNITGQLSDFLSGSFQRRVLANIAELARAMAALVPLLGFGLLAQQPGTRRAAARKLAGLLAVAPASHWAISAMVAGGHHWFPVILCGLLGLLELLRTARPGLATRFSGPLIGLFFAMNAFGLYYSPLKRLVKRTVLPHVLGYPAPDTSRETAHNRRIIRAMDQIPQDAKVSILMSPPIGAFVANRPHLWVFPAFFDQADLLVIDKDCPDTIAPTAPPDLTAAQSSLLASLYDGRDFPRKRRAALVDRMVRMGTHRVVRDDEDMWVLERTQRLEFPEPRSSLGFGFLAR